MKIQKLLALIALAATGSLFADYTCVITKGVSRAPAMAVTDEDGEYVYVHKKGGVYSDEQGKTYPLDDVSPVSYVRAGSPSNFQIWADKHCRCANVEIQNTAIGRYCKKMGNSNQAEGALLKGITTLRNKRKSMKNKPTAADEAGEYKELDELTGDKADANGSEDND